LLLLIIHYFIKKRLLNTQDSKFLLRSKRMVIHDQSNIFYVFLAKTLQMTHEKNKNKNRSLSQEGTLQSYYQQMRKPKIV